jgi:hypothetical protein
MRVKLSGLKQPANVESLAQLLGAEPVGLGGTWEIVKFHGKSWR